MSAATTTTAGSTGTEPADTRLMLRAAQLYYHGDLTQDAIGKRLGVSRFKVGRLLERALREHAVRIEIVHPAARLVALEDALVQRFDLLDAVVVDVPDREDEQLARERVAQAAADLLADVAPTGVIGVSWGRTMTELAARLQPGWTQAEQIVQLNGAISRSARPTRYQEVVERFGATTGAAIQLLPAPAIVGSVALREALEADPAVATPLRAARRAGSAVFGMGVTGPDSAHVVSGYLDARDQRRLHKAGAVGDVLGRFITIEGEIALPSLDERTVGLPLGQLCGKRSIGLAAGPGRGPVALGALRGACMKTFVTDEATAQWVLGHD